MKEIETVRTHDKLYLSENRKRTPKEYFKFVLKEVNTDLIKNGSTLDVGCATGDFLWFLGETFPGAQLVGADIDQELIERAKAEVPSARFICRNIAKDNIEERFDIIFMLGVHSIFDDIKDWLDPMVKLLSAKKESTVCVFGMFNPEDIDVLVRSRASSTDGPWETGWNIFSKKSVLDYCTEKKWACTFSDFNISIDIEKNLKDPLRSYTIPMQGDERLIVNGLQIVHRFSLMKLQPFS